MRRSWLWQNADKLAAVVTAIAALVALLYAHLQITEGRRAEREANAKRESGAEDEAAAKAGQDHDVPPS